MVRIGIAGIGFMGVTHFKAAQQIEGGRVVSAVDRKIDLDWAIRPTASMRRLERQAEREIQGALESMYGDLI